MWLKKGLQFCLVLALFSFMFPALAEENTGARVYEQRLANGMQLLVKEDHRSPTLVHMVWYRVGAMDEEGGKTGLSHMLEHMMFKGTKTVAEGEFSKIIARLGGRDNAFTSSDYTAYFQILPKPALAEAMRLESDRMQNLNFSDEAFSKERDVVTEERRLRTEDNPLGLLNEAHNALLFQAHPYQHPVIGWMDDIRNYRAEDIRQWYQRWYHPGNAFLLVVGDVDHKEVFALAEKYYGAIGDSKIERQHLVTEPPQYGARRTVVEAPADQPYLSIAWKVPKIITVDAKDDGIALQMLAAVLDGYSGARLNRSLVLRQQKLNSASASYEGDGRGPGVFSIDGAPAVGVSTTEVQQLLLAEIQRIIEHGVLLNELRRVRTQWAASNVFSQDSMMGQAMRIGPLEATGLGWRAEQSIFEAMQNVDAERLQEVARKYLRPELMNVAVLKPLPAAKPVSAEAAPALLRQNQPKHW